MWVSLGKRLDAANRTKIRSVVGAPSSVPVYFDDSSNPPKLVGEKGGHFTKSGERIRCPNAYAVTGFSNMVYVKSTLKIVVGKFYKW